MITIYKCIGKTRANGLESAMPKWGEKRGCISVEFPGYP